MRDDERFSALKAALVEECDGRRVYYFANPGNWGDALIREGALALFSDIGIQYVELEKKPLTWIMPFLKGGVFIYGGGGAWCKYYNTGEKYCRLFSRRFKTIVLPSTFDRAFSLRNTLFFRRDQFQSREFMPDSRFCHDLALYLEASPVTEGMGVGYFFRQDPESSGANQPPEENHDLSRYGDHFASAKEFFHHLSRYETITTDRLHVAIGGCLLGKKVHLHANSYFKNEAIFKSTLEGRFPKCVFHPEPFSTELQTKGSTASVAR